jgi:hypothetical protein
MERTIGTAGAAPSFVAARCRDREKRQSPVCDDHGSRFARQGIMLSLLCLALMAVTAFAPAK